MSGIVSDIQEQIKTIKIQKQLMKDSRKNEEGELEASINMLENFKKGNNIKKQEEAITYASSNNNVNNNDNINIHAYNDDVYISSNTNQQSNNNNSNNNLRNMNVYRENSGVQYSNNNALFSNNNRQVREESKCDDSKNEENHNYNNNQLYSYSNINTNTNNEDNNNFDENFNCDVRPINKNSFIYKHSKERENRDQRETTNNHINNNNYENNNTYSNRENNNFINNNNKMSKYENFLSEFDQLTTKKKEEVKPTILDKLASNKQKDDYSNYQSLGKISSVQTNNHNHSNNNTFEILSSNEEGLLKQNRERKAKSFLTKAEEKIHNYEQRKNEKKIQLMDMLTGTGGNDFNENYNNFNSNIRQNYVTNNNHTSSNLYQTHTPSNNGFNLGNYNQNEKNLSKF